VVEKMLRRVVGLRVARSSDSGVDATSGLLGPGEALVLEALGIVLIRSDPDTVRALHGNARTTMFRLEADRATRAAWTGRSEASSTPASGFPEEFADNDTSTWGVQATGALDSGLSGRGVRVAVLDTGIDARHPDFSRRAIVATSFVPGTDAGDPNGHGTYCAGLACGPALPQVGPRYGIAPAADLYVAKVLDHQANGTDGASLAGLDWAVRHGCAVVSLSLGTPVDRQDPPSELFEQAARHALLAGTLVFAAAGNGSQRPDQLRAVEHPANCPSIVAVGAINRRLAIAPFSNATLNSHGGEVDIVAPGVGVRSTWPAPRLYETFSGTSMAVPIAAGIACLYAEAYPEIRGSALRALILRGALSLDGCASGAGIALAWAPR
jgi:subtilisin